MNNKIIWLVMTAWTSGWALKAELPPKACINNLRLLEAATDQAAIEYNVNDGGVIQAHVISDYLRGGIASLKCPDKGVYTFGTVGKEPFCSMHGTMDGVMKGVAGLGTLELLGREPSTDAEVALDELLLAMARDQDAFDPTALKAKGTEGMRQLAERLFPQTAAKEGNVLSPEAFNLWMAKLASENFAEREEAQRKLSLAGGLYWQEVARAARSPDPEVKRRAASILETWDAGNKSMVQVDFARYIEAFKVYLEEMGDSALLLELQSRAKAAQAAGVINGSQKLLIEACLNAGTEK